MGPAVYVMSVVGESPAVLSELLWHLRKVDKRHVAGVEIWATGRGEASLRSLWDSQEWATLREDGLAIPDLWPRDSPPGSTYGTRIHALTENGRVLDDVRTQAEAEAVSATLHDRVRELRRELDDPIQLVGSLAGGRKTVSAALQTAFSLQAGVEDRLVHVLLGSELERWLRDQNRLREYCCPSPQWESESGVPQGDQVVVYDMAFPRVKHLVSGQLKRYLEQDKYKNVWPKLQRHSRKTCRATLFRLDDRKWWFYIVDSASEATRFKQTLRARPGALLAAIATLGGSPSAIELLTHLDANDFGWTPPPSRRGEKERLGRVRQAASALRDRQREIPAGFEQFRIGMSGYAAPDIEVVDGAPGQGVFDF